MTARAPHASNETPLERASHVGFRVLVVIARVILALFAATIPGASLRPVFVERVAPPLPPEVMDRDAELFVRVVDASHAPISGARVQALAVLGGRAHLAGAGTTNRAGEIDLSRLPHADHWIVADARGYARAATRVALSSGRRDIELVLAAEHHVDVEVADEAGAPIAGAEVEVAGQDPLPVGARTDASGVAKVGRLGEGPFVVTARAPGFSSETTRGVHADEHARLVLKKLGTLLVHVVDGAGAPASGARVQIAGVSLWPARVAVSDAAGEVKVGELGTGTYAARATRGDEASAIELGVPIQGGETRDVTLRLAPAVYVAVRVVEAEGSEPRDDEPHIAGAKITLAESGLSPFPFEAVSDKDGRARLGPLAPGPSSILAMAEGFVGQSLLVPDPPPPLLRVPLQRAGAIEGRVTDSRGFPVDGATIEIVGTDFAGGPIDEDPRRLGFRTAHFTAALAGPAPLVPAGELGVVPGPVPSIPHGASPLDATPLGTSTPAAPPLEPWVTRADGTYHVAPSPPGRVRVLVRHPQYVEAMSDVVTLSAGGTAKIDVVLRGGGDLEGRVVDESNRAVTGARVLVSAVRGSLERTTRTADDGSFAFAALPEEIIVSVADADDLGAVRVRMSMHIREGGKERITLTLPKERAALLVHVHDARGAPVPTAQITASSLDPSAPLRTTVFSDERGDARVAGARGLALRLDVFAPSFAPRGVNVDPSAESSDVVLDRGVEVRGEVREARRDPIAHAELTLYTDLGAQRAVTSTDGTFDIAGLAPGAVRLRARAAGFAPLARDLTLEADAQGRPVDLGRLELVAEASVDGVVVDDHDDPVQGARIAQGSVPTYLAVGATPPGIAVSDKQGRFHLGELPEGNVTLEAYAPDMGRTRVEGVHTVAGRVTDRVRIAMHRGEGAVKSEAPPAPGGVAVTLGVGDHDEMMIVAVAEGSAAERAGLAPGDVLVEIDGAKPTTMADARARMGGALSDDVVLRVRRGDDVHALRVPREPVRR